MPITEDYEGKYWFQTPEPVGTPGYTGYIPGYGPRRLLQFGKTFGEMTHGLLKEHPVAGLRLAPIIDTRQSMDEKLEQEVLAWKHEVSSQNNKYCKDMVSSYAGYVPRRRFLLGKSFTEECREATALMEKLKIMKEK